MRHSLFATRPWKLGLPRLTGCVVALGLLSSSWTFAQQPSLQRGERDLESYLQQGLRPADPLPVTTPPRYQEQLPPGQNPFARRPVDNRRRRPAQDSRRTVQDSRSQAGVNQAQEQFELERQRQIARTLEAQAEMQFWSQVTGYGLNGVVPLDVPYRFYVGNTPQGFPATYLNTFEQWPAPGGYGLPYPPTVYLDQAPGTHPTGFETVITGPNSYIYRPIYDDPNQTEIAPPPASYSSTVAGEYEATAPLVVEPTSEDAQRAVDLFQQRRYREALLLLNRAIATDVDDGSLELLRAQAYFARGDYDRAAASLQDALMTLPVDQWGLIATDPADFYLEPHLYPAQIDSLRGYVRQHPNSAAARLLLGYHLGFNGDPAAAAAELARAAELGSGDAVGAELKSMFDAAAQQQAAEKAAREPAPATEAETEDGAAAEQEFPRRGGRQL